MDIHGLFLRETARNPAPPGARIVPVETVDKVRLRCAVWGDTAQRRGTILLLQGRAEFIEKYFETIGELLERGFAVVAFDWRGQGGSGRSVQDPSKGHIADFALYRRDVEAIAASTLSSLPAPVFALAHSMGGCIAITGACEGWLPASRLLALAPMIDLKLVRHPRTVRALLRILSFAGVSERFVPGGDGRSISTLPYLGNRLSSDEGRYARNAELARLLGPLALGAPTIGWLASAYRAMTRFKEPRFSAGRRIPVGIVAAGDDPVCSTPEIMAFASRAGLAPALVIPDARHEILMESDAIRAAFWRTFDGFFSDRAA